MRAFPAGARRMEGRESIAATLTEWWGTAGSAERLRCMAPSFATVGRDGLDLLPKQVEAAWEAFGEAVHPVVELAWYLMHNGWRTEATRDEMVEDFRRARGEQDDPTATELPGVTGLVLYGWILRHSALVHPDPAENRWALEELAWWEPLVRRGWNDRTRERARR